MLRLGQNSNIKPWAVAGRTEYFKLGAHPEDAGAQFALDALSRSLRIGFTNSSSFQVSTVITELFWVFIFRVCHLHHVLASLSPIRQSLFTLEEAVGKDRG